MNTKILFFLSFLLVVSSSFVVSAAIDHQYYSPNLEVGDEYIWDILNSGGNSYYEGANQISMLIIQSLDGVDFLNTSVNYHNFLRFALDGQNITDTFTTSFIYRYHLYPVTAEFDNGTVSNYFEFLASGTAGDIVGDIYVQDLGGTELQVNMTDGIIYYFNQIVGDNNLELQLVGYTPVEVNPDTTMTDSTQTRSDTSEEVDESDSDFPINLIPMSLVGVIVLHLQKRRN